MKSTRNTKPVRSMNRPKKTNREGGFGVKKTIRTLKTLKLKSGKSIPNMMISTYGPFEDKNGYFYVVEFFDVTGTYHHYKPCQEDLGQKHEWGKYRNKRNRMSPTEFHETFEIIKEHKDKTITHYSGVPKKIIPHKLKPITISDCE